MTKEERNEYQRKYNAEHAEARKEAQKKYREAHRKEYNFYQRYKKLKENGFRRIFYKENNKEFFEYVEKMLAKEAEEN